MAMKYWVGDRFVDLSRNQITRHETVLTLAPKALAVLTLLAKNQGSVVPQDELLEHVWKNTIVTTNTLQRSIAQLRKAFEDDAKQQRVIKTHSKQGYSLELPVNWHENLDDCSSSAASNYKPRNSKSKSILILSVTSVALVVVTAVLIKHFQTKPNFSIKSVHALTATDNKEFNAIYSADGEYIIFNRYHEKFCRSRIWAKHLDSQQETKLTTWGNYGSISQSPDGTQIAFIERERCDTPELPRPCFSLKSLDFQKALAGGSTASTLMSCNHAQIKSPRWLSNEVLALMHKPGNQWQLLKFSIKDSKSDILYQANGGTIQSFDVALNEQRIALIKLDESSQPFLQLLTTDGELISNHAVQAHPDISRYKSFYPRFVPNESSLMFSTGRQLFSLSYEGNVERILLPLDQAMSTPIFGSNTKKALAIKGVYDSDIGSLDLSELEDGVSTSQSEIEFNNFARSNSSDEDGIFQPSGNIIAYLSMRTGTEQLWLSEGDTVNQLTQLPLDSRIRGFRWSSDGASLLINTDGELIEQILNGAARTVFDRTPITRLFHWDSDTDTAIVNMRERGREVFAKLDLNTREHITLKDSPAVWAAQSASGRLIYLDHNSQYWLSNVTEDILISPLISQGSDKRFVISGDTVYGVNEDFQLWKYKLDDQSMTPLSFLPKNTDYLTDAREDLLLLTYVNAAKKEVVELTLAE